MGGSGRKMPRSGEKTQTPTKGKRLKIEQFKRDPLREGKQKKLRVGKGGPTARRRKRESRENEQREKTPEERSIGRLHEAENPTVPKSYPKCEGRGGTR